MSGPSRRKALSGWRASGAALLLVAVVLTIIICSLLLASLFRLGSGWQSLGDELELYSGSCNTSSRLNLGVHVLINIVGSGILASSSFFMQILLAPTRRDIDKAHARSRFAEIGAQSFRNLSIVPLSNVALWLLFAVTSVPLHLVINSCVLESRASTSFLFVVGSNGFTKGAEYMAPGVGVGRWYPATADINETLADIRTSLSSSSWEKMSFSDCWERYNDTGVALTDYRHVVLVISNRNESETTGWTPAEVRYNATNDGFFPSIVNVENSLWFTEAFDRTDAAMNMRADGGGISYPSSSGSLDLSFSDDYFRPDFGAGILTSENLSTWSTYVPLYPDGYHNPFVEPYQAFTARYCLSEPFTAPCKLKVENPLLGIVCLIFIIKCILCIAVLLKLRAAAPLTTLGDAIESYILHPDDTTAGKCSLNRDDFAASEQQKAGWHQDIPPKPWKVASRRARAAVPRSIWLWTYGLISLAIGTTLFFFVQAMRQRSLKSSYFEHDARNPNVYMGGLLESAQHQPSTATLSVLANLPQLILSVCYLAYNGILTRLFSEFEWASYGVASASLRVTQPVGQQRAAYRLQLPLRWSIPLLIVSTLLHWMFSNCLYIIIFESHSGFYPYTISEFKWLQFSNVAILISFLTCVCIAVVPLFVGYQKLPGQMVLAANNSAVISAACHFIGDETTRLLSEETKADDDAIEGDDNTLRAVATGRVKWGVISQMSSGLSNLKGDAERRGFEHLGFASASQDVGEPQEGRFYAGSGLT